MPGPLRVTRSVVIPERELTWRFSRSSGPGGQSVNTADERARTGPARPGARTTLAPARRWHPDREGVRTPFAAPQPRGGARTHGEDPRRRARPAAASPSPDQAEARRGRTPAGRQEASFSDEAAPAQ